MFTNNHLAWHGNNRPADFTLGLAIPMVSELKYLGIILDRKLAFDRNAHATALRAKRIIGALWFRVGRFAGSGAIRTLCVVFEYTFIDPA